MLSVFFPKCIYADCRSLSVITLIPVRLSMTPSVIMQNVVMLSLLI